VFVGAQVVNPEFLGPRFFGCRLAIEETTKGEKEENALERSD
jgi:hypothetical protein